MTMFATPAVDCHREPDGTLVLRSRVRAGTPTATVLHWLRRFAAETPDAALLTVATGRDRSCSMLAPARGGEPLFGEATVDHSTRTVTFVSARLHSEGRTVLTASAVFRNPRPAPVSGVTTPGVSR